jgi:hypothetical protein
VNCLFVINLTTVILQRLWLFYREILVILQRDSGYFTERFWLFYKVQISINLKKIKLKLCVLSVRKLYSNSLFFLQEIYTQIRCSFCKKFILKFVALSARKLYSNSLCFLQENYIPIRCSFCKKIILKFFVPSARKLYSIFVLSARKLYSNSLFFLQEN